MTTKFKKISFMLICLFLLPALALAIGFGGPIGTAEAVILGPFIQPDLGGGFDYSFSDTPTAKEWSSSTGVTVQSPNADGSLKSFRSLYVRNDKFSKVYSPDRRYASFVKYFRIVRTDGRPIYDDDGVLDVRWWKDGVFTSSDEIVDYAADLYIQTQMCNYTYNGFLGTVLYDKFERASFEITWTREEDPEDAKTSNVHDLNLNDYGAGPYKNNSINPGYEYYKLTDMHWSSSPYVMVELNARAFWENCFWGGCFDYINIYDCLTGFMPRANRNWSNTLNSSANKGSYKGQVAYYSPKAYTVVATNLNNYIKYNGVQATPTSGTDVSPFKDGHHISIMDEGITTIEIENGAENVYTPYYCFVDTKLPDVSYTYHNSNALDLRRVGSITTSASGARTQSIYEGVFKDQVQVNFGYNENESPETATYKFNGKTQNLTSGTWLNEEGRYEVTITDAAGNKTISTFDVDKSYPTLNGNQLANDKTYKVAKWYLVNVPSGYKDYGTYSFKEIADAQKFAMRAERNTHVTNYVLNNIEDFVNTHLVAKGNSVKVGDYWYYKSMDNPDLFVYYFDENSLNEAIEFYSHNFVSTEQRYKLNAGLSPNNYGNVLDDSMYDNVISKNEIAGYIGNNFIFRTDDNNESYKIYYDYAEDNAENWIEFQYNKTFASQANIHGLYRIKEVDFAGHETFYYLFLDIQGPMLDVEAKIYGRDKTLSQTISVNDIPENHELIFYYETFKITNVYEDDKWWTMEIKNPDGQISRYIYLDSLPDFEGMKPGEYTVTIADRSANTFTFKVCLLGKAPEVVFTSLNANAQLKVDIVCSESYNYVKDIKIYRNGVCLNAENGYDEDPKNDNNPLIFIKPETLSYIFNKGGIYVVEITDNFERTNSYEYKFEKELPIGQLIGVKHNGKTNSEVRFVYDANKYYVVVGKSDGIVTPQELKNDNITTLIFTPEENAEIYYTIKLIDKTDSENYNHYAFTIKTIKPTINLFGVENNGTTGGTVYATWDSGDENYTAIYSRNGEQSEYKKGQNLSLEGIYEIKLTDEIGNFTIVNFEIDKSIDFVVADAGGITYEIEQLKFINFDIRIVNNEPLHITMTKDKEAFDYEFGLMISEEGYYEVTLYDEYNNSIYFYFTIDKTPPIATLYGVEPFGKTKDSAWVTSQEPNLICWYVVNEEYKDVYTLGQELKESGKYIVCVSDQARNIVTFEFEIDRSIAFDINVYRGGISNGGVRIIAYENLKIYMTKDGKPFDYTFEQILNDEGEYSYSLFDDLGNRQTGFFTIITKKKQNLNHILQEDIQIKSISKDNENYEFELKEGALYLYDEGAYQVNIIDNKTNKEYSFNITIDTTPPTLEIVGVENGGKTKKVVVLKNVSETPYELIIYVDGAPFEYKLGDKIEKSGRFEVILLDEAGNKTVYTFEREYSLNAASIGIIAGLGVLVVLLIILLIKSRHHYYKDEVIEEEITETTIDDDGSADEVIITDNEPENTENNENQ